MTKEIIAKTVVRTLIYQILALFVGISIGFLINPNYWGNRAPLVEQSIKNIFYPLEYNQDTHNFLIDVGRSRIFFSLPEGSSDLRIIEDAMISDEQYMADYEYVLNGKTNIVKGYITKINWKSWEYDYPTPDELDAPFPEN